MKSKKPKGLFMRKKDLINEHEDLVDTLEHPTKKKLSKEAKEQGSELKKYRRL